MVVEREGGCEKVGYSDADSEIYIRGAPCVVEGSENRQADPGQCLVGHSEVGIHLKLLEIRNLRSL